MLETDGSRYHISDEDTSFGSGLTSPVPLPQKSLAALSHRTYPDVVQWSPQRWHFFLVPCKIRPAVREKKCESIEQQNPVSKLLENGRKELWEVLGHPEAGQASWAGWGQIPCKGKGTAGSLPPALLHQHRGCTQPCWSWVMFLFLIFRQLVDSLTLPWFCVEDQPIYFVYVHTQTFRFGKARPSHTSAF